VPALHAHRALDADLITLTDALDAFACRSHLLTPGFRASMATAASELHREVTARAAGHTAHVVPLPAHGQRTESGHGRPRPAP
jgi:hypothetical protein